MERQGRIIQVLEKLIEVSCGTSDLVLAVLLAGYGASRAKINYTFRKLQSEREQGRIEALEKQKFYDLIYRLKKDGLIQKNRHKLWKITSRGIQKLEKFKLSFTKKSYKKQYDKKESDSLKIIIFDIPEKNRYKRAWLRSVLISQGFKMLQKSVWVGKKKIKEEFLNDLNEFNLLPYLEIFAVNKAGSLKQIT